MVWAASTYLRCSGVKGAACGEGAGAVEGGVGSMSLLEYGGVEAQWRGVFECTGGVRRRRQ